jgi:hypothetical protein
MVIFFLLTFFYDVGQTSANFLKLSIGARATAMGSAYTAIADDVCGIFYNPSTSGILNSFDFSFTFLNLYDKINYSSLATSLPIKNFGLGIGAALLSFSDDKYIGPGNKVGEYSCNDFLLFINFSFNLYKKFAFGTNWKYVGSLYDNYYAYSWATDFGFHFNPIKNLYFGSSLLHLGTKRKFIYYSEILPINFRLGASYKFFLTSKIIFTIASDLATYIDELPSFGIGGEVLFKELRKPKEDLALRIGYRTKASYGIFSGLAVGFGYLYQFFKDIFLSIDFTYLDYGYLGSQERISLTFKYLLP